MDPESRGAHILAASQALNKKTHTHTCAVISSKKENNRIM